MDLVPNWRRMNFGTMSYFLFSKQNKVVNHIIIISSHCFALTDDAKPCSGVDGVLQGKQQQCVFELFFLLYI